MSGGKTQYPPWRHHYIPEFYLKQWTLNGQLVEFSRPFKAVVPKRRYPRQTGWQRRLYALDGVPEALAHTFETEFFSPVDSQAADALKLLTTTNNSPTAAQRHAWARFLLSLLMRTPESLSDLKERLQDVAAVTDPESERRYRKSRRVGDPRTLAEAMRTIPREAYSRRAVSFIAEMTNSARMLEHIVRMRWGRRVLPLEVPTLMTSDRPLVWENGLGHPECRLIIATSPRTIFYAVNTQEAVWEMRCVPDRALLRYINETVVRRAERYVYATSDAQLAYVAKEMGQDRRPSFVRYSASLRMTEKQVRKGKRVMLTRTISG